jgi:hypothetical protein
VIGDYERHLGNGGFDTIEKYIIKYIKCKKESGSRERNREHKN